MSSAQSSRLFQEVNDRIYELLESSDPDLPGEFICECGRECGHRVTLLPAEFATLRQIDTIVQSPECHEQPVQGGDLVPLPALG